MRCLRSRSARGFDKIMFAQSNERLFAQANSTMTQKALARVRFLVRKNRSHVRLQYKKDLQSNHFSTKQFNFQKKYSTRRVFVGCCFLSKGVLSFGGFCPLFTVGTQMFTASSDCAVCGTNSAKRACCCDTNIFLID